MKWLTLILILFTTLLSGCELQPVTDSNSPFYSVPEGSRLILNQQLTIPAGQARIFIQNQQLYNNVNLIDQYHPYCEFEVKTLSQSLQQIQPDDFIIYRVVDEETQAAREPVLYASLKLSDIAPLLVAYNTTFYLKSAKQPDVLRLNCLHWDDLNANRYLSFTEISSTLGKVFSFILNIPDSSALKGINLIK